MAKRKPILPERFSFTLRVDVPLNDRRKPTPLNKDEGDDFRFHLDLNPDSFIYEAGSNTQIEKIEQILERITSYLDYVKELAEDNGYTSNRIAKIAYKRNSPALANVSFLAAVNGDMEPPAKPKPTR